MTGLRVGVDIGGTFTDLVVLNEQTGAVTTHKVLSTPSQPSTGMLRGIDELGIARDVRHLVHGTTAGLNALLSRAGDRIALVTTHGFRDVLSLRRAGNDDIWSLRSTALEPLVAREDVRTVRERVRADGSVELPLQSADVDEIADWLADNGIGTVAVCLLHSHRNAVHELSVRDLLTERLPGLSVVLSHEVSPEQGEYERTSTTVATAYVAKVVDRYLTDLVTQLADRGCTAPLQVMRSSGGVCSAELVARQPIQTILSGPAGGVVAAQTLSRALDRPDLLAIDMGGTSSDVSIVVGGEIALDTEGQIADQAVRMPMVELHTIGAGGGSVARAESGGLRVGPQSAGADPGPACYGQGGTWATVTDAQVLLGRIDPDWFLGGRMKLDLAAAQQAMGRVADDLGLDVLAAAEGVLAVANSKMANAIRTLALRRGIDPRRFTLVAFGGAGPLHSAALAEELGIEEVVVPYAMGVLSAWGMLHADVRHDVSAPLAGRADSSQALAVLERALAHLYDDGRKLLDREGVPEDRRHYLATADMRYVGQEHTIAVPLPALAIGAAGTIDAAALIGAFHVAYELQYGHAMPAAPVELVNARLSAVGATGSAVCAPALVTPPAATGGTRTVRIDGVDHDAAVVHRGVVPYDTVLKGPLIVQEEGSTTLVPPGWTVRTGPMAALVMTRTEERP